MEEMLKLRTEWQGRVSHGGMWEEKMPIQRSQGGNGIDIFQKEKESKYSWRVGNGRVQR